MSKAMRLDEVMREHCDFLDAKGWRLVDIPRPGRGMWTHPSKTPGVMVSTVRALQIEEAEEST